MFSGMGKGKYYVGHPEYQRRFSAKLGYRPYPGTLNIKLDDASVEGLRKLRQKKGVEVEGFTIGEESFSSLRCYGGMVGDERAALLVIDVTHYNDTVSELIAQTYLRGKLGLMDGDIVGFEAELD